MATLNIDSVQLERALELVVAGASGERTAYELLNAVREGNGKAPVLKGNATGGQPRDSDNKPVLDAVLADLRGES